MKRAAAALPPTEPWPDHRGETLTLPQASGTGPPPRAGMRPPPPRRPRSSADAAGADAEGGACGASADLPPRHQPPQQPQPLALAGEPADVGPLSPSDLLNQPPRKRARSRAAGPPPLPCSNQQQEQEQAAAGAPAASPYASAPPSLFVSDATGFSPLGPLSPLDGRLRRSSAMSSATAVSWLPPISPLDLGGIEQQLAQQQFVGASPHPQQQGGLPPQLPSHKQQQAAAGQPPVHPGLLASGAARRPAPRFAVAPLALDGDAAAAGAGGGGPAASNPGAAAPAGPSGGALTPHLGDAFTPGRLLLGSPVDLGDAAAELGLLPGGADVCGLLASPEHATMLTSPRGGGGGLLASLRDVILASPMGTGGSHGAAGAVFNGASLAALLGGAAGGVPNGAFVGGPGAAAGAAAAAAANPLAGALSPLLTPHFAGQARNSWARRESRQRSSLLSASTPQPELAAWVPCSSQSAGAAASGAPAAGGWQEVQPPWVSAGAARPAVELQRATSKGGSHRHGGIRGLKQRGGGGALAAAQQQQEQQQDDARGQQDQCTAQQPSRQQQQQQGARGPHASSAGGGRPTRRPWNGRNGVPVSILRELPGRSRPAPMLDSLERVWERAGRLPPAPALAPI